MEREEEGGNRKKRDGQEWTVAMQQGVVEQVGWEGGEREKG